MQFKFKYFKNTVFKSFYFQMMLIFYHFNKTLLHSVIEKGNIEIVKLLIKCPEVDINQIIIYMNFFLNTISN